MLSRDDTGEPEKPSNLVWHPGHVARAEREAITGQRGCVVWMTGLSGSGKSTLARALERELMRHGHLAYVLDGDNIRHGLNADLDFSPAGRGENIRRVSEVAALLADTGIIAITAFISPYRADRDRARKIVTRAQTASVDDKPANTSASDAPCFLEIFIDTPLAVCEARDPKGLYARARTGEIGQFTGICAPYEPPLAPALTLATEARSVDECVQAMLATLAAKGILPP